MKVIAQVDLYKNKGMSIEKQTFIKGNEYYYYLEDSTTNQKLVEPEEGERSSFTDEDFRKYFKLKKCNSHLKLVMTLMSRAKQIL